MDNNRERFRNRRYLGHVSIIGTTQIHKRNPYTIGAWSLAFPGFGHLLLNKYLRGYALIVWEFFVNQKIHLNAALAYSFNGQFQAARETLDPRFTAMYIPVYLFAIWDSYRTAVDMNKVYVLAHRENGPFNEFSIGGLEVNYLDKRKPWLALLWSMGVPSTGQLYLHRIVLAVFVLASTFIIVWKSNLILAIHYLLLGDIRMSNEVLNGQWLLYVPSFYLFSIYEAYTSAVENNKLFSQGMRRFLIQNYQPAGKLLSFGDTVK